jgi:hypothetical protein
METLLGRLPNGDDDDLVAIKREAGTFETCRLYGAMSAFGGNSEDICSHRVLLGWTQSRRRPGLKVVQLRLSSCDCGGSVFDDGSDFARM